MHLNEKNLTELNGNYSFYPLKAFREGFNDLDADSLRFTNSYQEIINENWNQRQKTNSTLKKESIYLVKIKITESKKLDITLLENGFEIRDTILNGKLKNGMFYIDNKYLKCKGIPYLFGGCENNKRRIGLSVNNNLITNEAVNNEGAVLLILGGGANYNDSFEFKRIK